MMLLKDILLNIMQQKGMSRNDLLREINKIEDKLGDKHTTHVSFVYGFNENYWRPKLVKKISAVIGVNLLPYIPNNLGKEGKLRLDKTFKGMVYDE